MFELALRYEASILVKKPSAFQRIAGPLLQMGLGSFR
jgi:hypothetical protein